MRSRTLIALGYGNLLTQSFYSAESEEEPRQPAGPESLCTGPMEELDGEAAIGPSSNDLDIQSLTGYQNSADSHLIDPNCVHSDAIANKSIKFNETFHDDQPARSTSVQV